MPRRAPALVAVATAALVLLLLQRGGAGRDALAPAAPADERDGAAAPLLDAAAPGERRAVAAPAVPVAAPPDTAAVAPPRARLLVRAVDQDGVPAPRVTLYAAPPGLPLNRVGETDAWGEVDLAWVPRRWPAALLVELQDGRGRSLVGLRRLEFSAGDSARLELTLDNAALPAPGAPVELRPRPGGAPGSSGGPAGTASFEILGFEGPLDYEVELSSISAIVQVHAPGRGTYAPWVDRGSDGTARFVAGIALPVDFDDMIFDVFESSETSSVEGEFRAPPPARVVGTVRDPSGAPLGAARVALERADGAALQAVRSDADGRFAFEVAPGAYVLRAGGTQRGARTSVSLAPGVEFEWAPVLDRGPYLAGRVHATEGAAWLEASVLEHLAGGGVLCVSVGERATGLPITLPWRHVQPATLHVTNGAAARPADCRRFEGLAVGVPFDLRLEPSARLRLAPCDLMSDDEYVPAANDVRLVEPGGGRAARVRAWGERGAALEIPVGPGAWALSLTSCGAHSTEPVTLDLLPGADADLGQVAWPAWGTVVTPARAADDPAQAVELVLARPDGDCVVIPRTGPGRSRGAVYALPPGEYLWRHAGGAEEPFTLGGGGASTLAWRPE